MIMIARSTMEAEFIALDTICSKVEWLKNLISELPLIFLHVPAISFHIDSRAAIDLLKQETINRKLNRHLQIRFKFVKSLLGKFVTLDYVKLEKNLVDHLIKSLSRSVVLDSLRGWVKSMKQVIDGGNPTSVIVRCSQ